MKRIKNLDGFQKLILLATIVVAIAITAIFFYMVSREGFAYKDEILVLQQENGNTVYSGKIKGRQAEFVISADKVIRFQYGDKAYGPYTVKPDATAIPEQSDMRDHMTGIEVHCGNKVMFRGGIVDCVDHFLFYNEDGSEENIHIYATMSDGTVVDADGNEIDPVEPTVSEIIELYYSPQITSKVSEATWVGWIGAVIVCLINVVGMLYADEWFCLRMAFIVKNVDSVEPSDWGIASRYIGWMVLPILAVCLFVMSCNS
jgi:hypothetical protein